jgi:hypothetical protein
MGLIISLIGPPAAGKSYFAAKYTAEHPEFVYCSIDEYRIKHEDEANAWEDLYKDVQDKEEVILESGGLSWRLEELFNSDEVRKKLIVTIAFTGNADVLHERLTNRQKRPVPMSKHLAPIDVTVDTTKRDINEIYESLCTFLAKKRIEAKNNKEYRQQTFKRRPLWTT